MQAQQGPLQTALSDHRQPATRSPSSRRAISSSMAARLALKAGLCGSTPPLPSTVLRSVGARPPNRPRIWHEAAPAAAQRLAAAAAGRAAAWPPCCLTAAISTERSMAAAGCRAPRALRLHSQLAGQPGGSGGADRMSAAHLEYRAGFASRYRAPMPGAAQQVSMRRSLPNAAGIAWAVDMACMIDQK